MTHKYKVGDTVLYRGPEFLVDQFYLDALTPVPVRKATVVQVYDRGLGTLLIQEEGCNLVFSIPMCDAVPVPEGSSSEQIEALLHIWGSSK